MKMFKILSTLPIFPVATDSAPAKHAMQVQADDVSDGYHTMTELYEHRHALFIALINMLDREITPLSPPFARCWKSQTHNDGTRYEGWFLLGFTLKQIPWKNGEPITEQTISYHLPLKYWNYVHCMSLPKAPPFDGYTPEDVRKRLLTL